MGEPSVKNTSVIAANNEGAKKLFAVIRSKLREKRIQHKAGKNTSPIELEIKKPVSDQEGSGGSDTKWWIEELFLMETDRKTITTGVWMNAAIINASQVILKRQFGKEFCNGFQDVGYGLTMNFSIQERFVQILHDNDRHHWLTISNFGSDQPETVQVYDSMFSYSSQCLRAQVACILHTNKPSFKLQFVDVHLQDGSNDCGIFSIAYAVTICYGMQPGRYVFEQTVMRDHLLSCLQLQQFTPFPVRSERRFSMKVRKTEDVSVFCNCRMPDISFQPDMICCTKCDTWFHAGVCIPSVPRSAWDKNTPWYCPNCISLVIS